MSDRQFLRRLPFLVFLIGLAGSSCLRKSEMPTPERSSAAAGSNTAALEQNGSDAGNQSSGGDEESCVDQWLARNKLDSYGAPKGTMYIGGTPLFDESTGKKTPRLEYVYSRQPEAKKACRPTQQ